MQAKQTNQPSDTISIVPIFAGGGTRLPAHIGILTALEDLSIPFKHLVGVSGGSIVSSLYACGLPLETLKSIAIETDFNQFRGRSLFTLLREGGLSTGNHFESWIDERLEGRCFKDLQHNLHIVATDVAEGKPVIFNATNTPDMKVSKAVRFSMSIPLLFSFQKFQQYIMVDGSILSEDALHRDWAEDGTPVLCFRLRSEGKSQQMIRPGLFPLKSYVTMLIRTFMNTISREYINDHFWHNTIIVDTGSISPVDFNLSESDKHQLFDAGYETALQLIPKKIIPYIDTGSYN